MAECGKFQLSNAGWPLCWPAPSWSYLGALSTSHATSTQKTHHSESPKAFRSFVPGIWGKDQIFISCCSIKMDDWDLRDSDKRFIEFVFLKRWLVESVSKGEGGFWSGMMWSSLISFHLKPYKSEYMVVVNGGGVLVTSCVQLLWPMDYSLPGSSIHRISQARILEWVAISFSNLLNPGIEPGSPALKAIFCIASKFFTNWATKEALVKYIMQLRKNLR